MVKRTKSACSSTRRAVHIIAIASMVMNLLSPSAVLGEMMPPAGGFMPMGPANPGPINPAPVNPVPANPDPNAGHNNAGVNPNAAGGMIPCTAAGGAMMTPEACNAADAAKRAQEQGANQTHNNQQGACPAGQTCPQQNMGQSMQKCAPGQEPSQANPCVKDGMNAGDQGVKKDTAADASKSIMKDMPKCGQGQEPTPEKPCLKEGMTGDVGKDCLNPAFKETPACKQGGHGEGEKKGHDQRFCKNPEGKDTPCPEGKAADSMNKDMSKDASKSMMKDMPKCLQGQEPSQEKPCLKEGMGEFDKKMEQGKEGQRPDMMRECSANETPEKDQCRPAGMDPSKMSDDQKKDAIKRFSFGENEGKPSESAKFFKPRFFNRGAQAGEKGPAAGEKGLNGDQKGPEGKFDRPSGAEKGADHATEGAPVFNPAVFEAQNDFHRIQNEMRFLGGKMSREDRGEVQSNMEILFKSSPFTDKNLDSVKQSLSALKAVLERIRSAAEQAGTAVADVITRQIEKTANLWAAHKPMKPSEGQKPGKGDQQPFPRADFDMSMGLARLAQEKAGEFKEQCQGDSAESKECQNLQEAMFKYAPKAELVALKTGKLDTAFDPATRGAFIENVNERSQKIEEFMEKFGTASMKRGYSTVKNGVDSLEKAHESGNVSKLNSTWKKVATNPWGSLLAEGTVANEARLGAAAEEAVVKHETWGRRIQAAQAEGIAGKAAKGLADIVERSKAVTDEIANAEDDTTKNVLFAMQQELEQEGKNQQVALDKALANAHLKDQATLVVKGVGEAIGYVAGKVGELAKPLQAKGKEFVGEMKKVFAQTKAEKDPSKQAELAKQGEQLWHGFKGLLADSEVSTDDAPSAVKENLENPTIAGLETKVAQEGDVELLNNLVGAVDPKVTSDLRLALIRAGADAVGAIVAIAEQEPQAAVGLAEAVAQAPKDQQAPLMEANGGFVEERGNFDQLIGELKESGDVAEEALQTLENAQAQIKGNLFAPEAAERAADATAELVDAVYESTTDEAIIAITASFIVETKEIEKESKKEAFDKKIVPCKSMAIGDPLLPSVKRLVDDRAPVCSGFDKNPEASVTRKDFNRNLNAMTDDAKKLREIGARSITVGAAVRDALKGYKITPPDVNLKDDAAVISYAATKGLVDQDAAEELGGDLAKAPLTHAGMAVVLAGADAAWGNTKK